MFRHRQRARLAWNGGLRLRLIRPTSLVHQVRDHPPPTKGDEARRHCRDVEESFERVGWVERLVRRSSMSEGGSDTHQLHFVAVMGFVGLNLSRRSTRSPDAAQRAALAAWCAADPGSIVPLARGWVPALRSSARALHRVRDTRNVLPPPSSDLPVGRFVDRRVESYF
jgi:hypothetical protein